MQRTLYTAMKQFEPGSNMAFGDKKSIAQRYRIVALHRIFGAKNVLHMHYRRCVCRNEIVSLAEMRISSLRALKYLNYCATRNEKRSQNDARVTQSRPPLFHIRTLIRFHLHIRTRTVEIVCVRQKRTML